MNTADGAAKGAELLAAATPAYSPAPPTSTNDTNAAFAGRELPALLLFPWVAFHDHLSDTPCSV